MRGIWPVVLVAAAVACVPPGGAEGPEPRAAGEELEAPPILSLLGERERLSLGPEQVVALDSIAREWTLENDRQTVRGGTTVSTGVATTVSRGRPTVRNREAVAENNRRAARAVEAVLTPEQRRLVCDLQSARGGARASRVWPWCVEAGQAP